MKIINMYCHKCGEKTIEEICNKCGTRIVQLDSLIVESWISENDFNKIIRHPEILELVSQYSEESKNKLSGEELLSKFDLVFGTFTGISIGFIAEIVVPIYSRLGIKTGKSDSIRFHDSIQEIFVKTMCSLAKHNYSIEEFHEAKDGIVLVGKIKSDLRSFGCKVIIELLGNSDFVDAKVQTLIKGQLYDWGKSKKIVKSILKDLSEIKLKKKAKGLQ